MNPESPVVPAPKKPPVIPIVFGFCAFLGVAWSLGNGWFGLALGVGVIASAVMAQIRGQRALVALVWKKPPGLVWTLATGALGALYIACAIAKFGIDRRRAAAAEARTEATLSAQRAQAAELQRLNQELPQAVSAFRSQLEDAERSADAGGPQQALRRATAVQEAIAALAARLGATVPADLVAMAQEADVRVGALKARAALADHYESIDRQLGFAKEAIARQNFLAADGDYAGALDAVNAVENSRATLAQFIPKAFDAARKRAEIQALRARIVPQVAKAKKQEQIEADKRVRQAAYEAICGPAPGLNPGDNAWVLLKMTIEKTANDPDSIEIVGCTPPVMTEKICWATRCNIRGKNAFGARILQQKWYAFSKLGVEEATLPGR